MKSAIHIELVKLMNRALALEYAAVIQYRTHAEAISGLNAEKIIERLQEIAGDEEKHAEKFRTLIASYLGGKPAMTLAEVYEATDLSKILSINLKGELEAIDFYKEIYRKIIDHKNDLPYIFEILEHEVRHIIMEEQEHVIELKLLIGE